MAGYRIQPAEEGSGLLALVVGAHAPDRIPRLLATCWPDGRPHVMPVWDAWLHDSLWFSSSRASCKARNLEHDPRRSATTDNPFEPVIVDGVAERVADRERIAAFLAASNARYATDYEPDFPRSGRERHVCAPADARFCAARAGFRRFTDPLVFDA